MLKDKQQEETTSKELSYVQKVWHAVTVLALLVAVILISRVAFNMLLMVLAGSLIAVYFHGLGDIIQRKTNLSRKPAMILSILVSFAILALLFWFMGTKIQVQINQLSNTLPHTISTARAKMAETPFGQKVLDYLSSDNSQKLFSTVQRFFSTSFGVLGNLYIIILLGIFFTLNPSLYKRGLILLVPPKNKELAQHILCRISFSLKGWIKGMMLSIVLITLILTLGLTIIGVPVALILALIAGMLKIIPNFGSLLAIIPAILLGLTISTNTAIGVALLYMISQTIVSNIITPLIQKKMINLPPALTIISQVIMGILCGALGIIMAVPLLAIIIILIDELYVKKINDFHEEGQDL